MEVYRELKTTTVAMRQILSAVYQFVFPHCCVGCGDQLHTPEFFICDDCVNTRFESPQEQHKLILPEFVTRVYSMWKFDKGGDLQNILHQLKYHRLTGAGIQLGRLLGAGLDDIAGYFGREPLLIPVPLHRKKLMKRGFNQARVIADGIGQITGWPVVDKDNIIRQKNTTSQTGLSTAERAKNLKNAFLINKPDVLRNFQPVIVDDVFTTGTTTFELAGAIYGETGLKSIIVTVALA